MGDMQFPQDCK
ncbi:hypothetical protein JL09_g6487 [Pichia kudriavzevii]|uniref:Uncharacterized protein n=1 Tax=Pichia kudriavzevii TaxID=4909 RepID=A0A099NR42_PICKU|nr:hypothetical protein JL09_g6487 [Pichia kudriavzevii]